MPLLHKLRSIITVNGVRISVRPMTCPHCQKDISAHPTIAILDPADITLPDGSRPKPANTQEKG
jgi:hypothetical protein